MLVRLKYACFYFHIVCLKGCAMLYLPECAVLGKIQHTEVDTALLAETTSRCAAFHFTLTEMAKECCCLLLHLMSFPGFAANTLTSYSIG